MREERVDSQTPRLALIGCGAIAEAFHLPALAETPEALERLVLVDPDRERARSLADRYGAGGVAPDHREVLDKVEGAIVAAPQQVHHSIVTDCLRAGVDVLCEKPLAGSAPEAEELVASARDTGARIAVNNTRRLYPATRKVRELIEEGRLGALRRIEFVEGEPFGWPAASDSYFGVKGGGKGVLLDKGAHVLDLVCWWLGRRPDLLAFRDDAMGGTEAVCRVDFEADGCSGTVALSWLTKLENEFRIVGERGRVRGTLYGWDSVTYESDGGRQRELRSGRKRHVKADFARTLIRNFLDVVRGDAEPLVPAEAVLDSLELIDSCYAGRRRFDMPWFEPHGSAWEREEALGVG